MGHMYLLVLLCGVVSPVKHSFKFYFSASTGLSNLPQFSAALLVDGTQASYCDSNNRTEPTQDAWRRILDQDRETEDFYRNSCSVIQPNFFKGRLHMFMEIFNQSGGVHTLQAISGCEWDEDSGEVSGSLRYAYDGEDLISLDLGNLSWVALRPQAAVVQRQWNADRDRITEDKNYLTQIWPQWLKTYLNFSSVLESVSLLQKSPSSPVSCHATGFYPNRAEMFWVKDGVEIHEDVDQGEILPNHDGTFQMRADLDVSSIKDEAWSRYDCVVQISGVEDAIITELDKATIRTNVSSGSGWIFGVIAGVLLSGSIGYIGWKAYNNASGSSSVRQASAIMQ